MHHVMQEKCVQGVYVCMVRAWVPLAEVQNMPMHSTGSWRDSLRVLDQVVMTTGSCNRVEPWVRMPLEALVPLSFSLWAGRCASMLHAPSCSRHNCCSCCGLLWKMVMYIMRQPLWLPPLQTTCKGETSEIQSVVKLSGGWLHPSGILAQPRR
jgi:hypothetical protein